MLRIYPFIIETLKLLAPIFREIARYDADLARQARRAGSSVALNTAEAIGQTGGNERARFRTAHAETQELRSCLDVAEALEYIAPVDDALRDRLDRIAATLFRLAG